jgi:16S rRNA (guanine966-N2)-methyltransferase
MPKPCEVNIIGGKFRSRKISFPELPELRPTPNRIRETLFDWLQQDAVGARCLDAFAGSGALGFEALSRGADSVVFLEKDRAVIEALTRNAEALKVTEQIDCIQQNSVDWLNRPNTGKAFNLVFLDPPFHQPWLIPCLEALATGHWLAPDAWVYIESAQPLDTQGIPQAFDLYRHKKAGQVYYGLLRCLTKA